MLEKFCKQNVNETHYEPNDSSYESTSSGSTSSNPLLNDIIFTDFKNALFEYTSASQRTHKQQARAENNGLSRGLCIVFLGLGNAQPVSGKTRVGHDRSNCTLPL